MKYKKTNTTNMRDYSITRNKGEWYDARVIDSYGNKYQNYFELLVKQTTGYTISGEKKSGLTV